MRVNDTEAAQRVAEHENLVGELVSALRDCVHVMERELNGLAVIQPELRQARAVIAKAEGATA